MTTKRAVIYARVSTDEQANGYSLDTQIEACGKYISDVGFTLVGGRYFDCEQKCLVDEPNENTVPYPCFADDYTGTAPIELRPEGRKVYDMLASNGADVLVAYRVDRIIALEPADNASLPEYPHVRRAAGWIRRNAGRAVAPLLR